MKRYSISYGKSTPVERDVSAFYKIIKQYFNNLKCPICKDQLDGSLYRGTNNIVHNVCVQNPNEYAIWVNVEKMPLVVIRETATIYHQKYKYFIDQEVGSVETNTTITVDEVDIEGRIINIGKQKEFTINKKMFTFQSMDLEQILNRIKTILVFQ